MTHRVLVPLDGSDKDVRAVQIADAMATVVRGDIHLLHVAEYSRATATADLTEELLSADTARERDLVGARLHEIAKWLSTSPERRVTWEISDGPDVATHLLSRLPVHADIVVMATSAPGALERAFFGSVADEIVRQSTVPVVIVPPAARYVPGQRTAIHRALVPLDGSRPALGVIERLLELVEATNLEYVLMQAVPPERTGGYVMPDPATPFMSSGLSQPAADVTHVQAQHVHFHLAAMAGALQRLGEAASVIVADSGDPARAIGEAAHRERCDLIAMSTHGRGGLRRVLLGSVANYVVRHSHVPVLLVTPRASVSD